MNNLEIIQQHFDEHIETAIKSVAILPTDINNAVQLLQKAITNNKKILCCGNGGSSGDASHIASELINRFEIERPAIAAISLTTDSAVVTSIANDYKFDKVFSRQIEALGSNDDILIAFSTSGNSTNIIEAIKKAHSKKLMVIAFTGRNGGEITKILNASDIELRVPAEKTSRIQEVHLVLIHCLCDLIDKSLFS